MQRIWIVGFIACAEAVAAEPEVWRTYLAKDLVKVAADKWEIEEYSVCTARERKGTTAEFLWRSHVEVVPFEGLSRDNVVAIWSMTETLLHEQLGREVNPKHPDEGWDCAPLLGPIGGRSTFTLEMRMDAEGFGFRLDLPDGKTSSQFRTTWTEAYER